MTQKWMGYLDNRNGWSIVPFLAHGSRFFDMRVLFLVTRPWVLAWYQLIVILGTPSVNDIGFFILGIIPVFYAVLWNFKLTLANRIVF